LTWKAVAEHTPSLLLLVIACATQSLASAMQTPLARASASRRRQLHNEMNRFK
jgi:hypothetical protein